jgi:hypothetical protein
MRLGFKSFGMPASFGNDVQMKTITLTDTQHGFLAELLKSVKRASTVNGISNESTIKLDELLEMLK